MSVNPRGRLFLKDIVEVGRRRVYSRDAACGPRGLYVHKVLPRFGVLFAVLVG